MKYLPLLLVLLFGCAQLTKVQDRARDKLADGVIYVCEDGDAQYRDRVVDDVNKKIVEKGKTYKVSVTCE